MELKRVSMRFFLFMAMSVVLLTGCQEKIEEPTDTNIIVMTDEYNAACNQANRLKNYTVVSVTERKIESANPKYNEDTSIKTEEFFNYANGTEEGKIISTAADNTAQKIDTIVTYMKDGKTYTEHGDKKYQSTGFVLETNLLWKDFGLSYNMVKAAEKNGNEYTFHLAAESCPDSIRMEYTLDNTADDIVLTANIEDGLLTYVSLEVEDTATERELALNNGLMENSEEFKEIKNPNGKVKTRVFSSTQYSDINLTKIEFPKFSDYEYITEATTELTSRAAEDEDGH